MTAGLFATLAITHVGPLTESPVSAKAASVPNAAVRFWTKPTPSFSSMLARPRSKSEPDFERGLASMDEKLGVGFVQNLTAALGTEAALALTGLSVSGPTWVMASVANNPAVIDSSLQKLVETFNAELGPDEQGKRIVLLQESAGGRTC